MDILVVLILNAILFGAESFAEVGKTLDRLFIDANNGIVFVIWATVYFKHILHRGNKSGTVFRRNAPAFLQVRLKFVLLRIVEIVTCDMDSIYPSSTVLSARSRSVHLEYPSGGCPHASAMMCASTSPVTFRRDRRRDRRVCPARTRRCRRRESGVHALAAREHRDILRRQPPPVRLFPQQIAVILGANETYLSMVSDYIFWYSVFLLTTMLGACLNTFARNDGNPGLSIVMKAVMTTANVFGDWLMVYPLKKGVAGAAIATGAANLLRVPRGAVTLHTEKRQTALPPFQTSALTLPKDNPPRRLGDDLAVREPDHRLLNEQYAHNAPRENRGECVFSDHLRELAVLFPDLGSRERSPAALRREG